MEPAVPGPSRIDKSKGAATHSRRGSIDENPRASNSSFPSSTASAAKADREGDQPNSFFEEEDRTGHIRERPKKYHHRRMSSKRHVSPGRSPNPMEYAPQSPEDPARGILPFSIPPNISNSLTSFTRATSRLSVQWASPKWSAQE